METIIITLDNNKKKEYVKGIKLKEIIEQELRYGHLAAMQGVFCHSWKIYMAELYQD